MAYRKRRTTRRKSYARPKRGYRRNTYRSRGRRRSVSRTRDQVLRIVLEPQQSAVPGIPTGAPARRSRY